MDKKIKDFCIRWLYDDYTNVYYDFKEKMVWCKGDLGERLYKEFGIYSDEINPYSIRHPFLDELHVLIEKYENELSY